jgi:tRNA (mo5U34)-methyltransferase
VAATPRPSASEAEAFLDSARFVWHQRFELVPEIYTPGERDIEYLLRVASLPRDLSGKSVLDIGTANGGAAFSLERLGADRVIAVDIYPPDWFGFDALSEFLQSKVDYVQGTVYELPDLLAGERFDLVLFWGVLYHLRHPLLALDGVSAALHDHGEASIETAVMDEDHAAVAEFYRGDGFADDASNWFVPSVACFEDWCVSSGLEPLEKEVWGAGQLRRSMIRARRTPGEPEFTQISYESPLAVRALGGPASTPG